MRLVAAFFLQFVANFDPFVPLSVQTPGAKGESFPRRREPREHAGEQLPATLHSRQQIQQLALLHHGRRVVAVVIGAGCEDSEVILSFDIIT